MALMMGKLYAALRSANVPDGQAADAAEEVAAFDNRIANLAGKLTLVQWMLGFNLALTVAVVIRLFGPALP